MKSLNLAAALPLSCSGALSFMTQHTLAISAGGKAASRYPEAVADKPDYASRNTDKQTAKCLTRLQREEAHLYEKLLLKDYNAVAQALNSSKKQYKALQQKRSTTQKSGNFFPVTAGIGAGCMPGRESNAINFPVLSRLF